MTVPTLGQLPEATARVACSGETHAVRWEAGDLVALDHADPEGERALAALGGQSCTCLDVLCAWTRRHADAALLSALSRGPQDPVHAEGVRPGLFVANPATSGPMWRPLGVAGRRTGLPGRIVNSGFMTGVAVAPGAQGQHATAPPTPADDVVLLAGLGHELTLRMVATVTSTLLDDLVSPEGTFRHPALEASLFGRASAALRTWLGTAELELNLEVIEPETEPGLNWDGRGPVHLALPLEWVMTVWGCDLTVVAGRFCLGVAERNGTRTTLISVGSDLASPRPLTIEIH